MKTEYIKAENTLVFSFLKYPRKQNNQYNNFGS